MDKKSQANEVAKRLKATYPQVEIALNFNSPFELLVATILSAQCTDARVNIVTLTLFQKFKNPQDFSTATLEEIEKEIFSTGFYKQKAKSIKNCSEILVTQYGGEVPKDFDSRIAVRYLENRFPCRAVQLLG